MSPEELQKLNEEFFPKEKGLLSFNFSVDKNVKLGLIFLVIFVISLVSIHLLKKDIRVWLNVLLSIIIAAIGSYVYIQLI